MSVWEEKLALLDKKGLKRELYFVEARKKARIYVQGKWYINLSSNDYLGLSLLIPWEKFLKYIESLGFGAGASRLLSGNHISYKRLEETLSDLYKRSALFFSSGYLANLGIISSLVGRGDVVFADKLVHASIIDGIHLSRAALFRFPHNDLDTLSFLLQKKRKHFRRALIITESLFSMEGDIPDLKVLVQLKKDFEALLFLDEAHAVGIFGSQGLGISQELGVLSEIDVLLGTFGKALGGYGAFVIVEKSLKDYLINKARSFIFTTALPPLILEANLWCLKKMLSLKEDRESLRKKAQRLREELASFVPKSQGLSKESQIIPLIIGENKKCLQVSQKLKNLGYWVPAIRPPTVPKGTARLRLSLTSSISWEDLVPLIEYLRQLEKSIR